jgi:drug/metabolite transporter (DMT)-like permease
MLSTVLAGNNAIAVRFSNAELPPFFGAGLRFILSSAVLLVIVLVARLPIPSGRALVGALIVGALQYGFSYAFIYWSLLEVPAGLFQVILALVPLMTFIFAILHRQETFEGRILGGGLLAVAGIAVIFRDQINADVQPFSLLAIVLAAVCIAEASVLYKKYPGMHPVTTNMVGMLLGALLLFFASWLFGEPATIPVKTSTWLVLSYLVIFGSVTAFVLIFFVLSRWKASIAAYQLVIMPVVTIISANIILGEPVTNALLLGGSLVLLGVYIGALSPPELFERLSGVVFGRKK